MRQRRSSASGANVATTGAPSAGASTSPTTLAAPTVHSTDRHARGEPRRRPDHVPRTHAHVIALRVAEPPR